jgi:hypothetical protein
VAYCPECLVEYAQGSPECIDCRVPLISGQPPNGVLAENTSDIIADLDLVTVRSFMGTTSSFDAELARNVLDGHGIPAMLIGENSARFMPTHITVFLQVERKNQAHAVEILEGVFDNPEAQLPDDEPI